MAFRFFRRRAPASTVFPFALSPPRAAPAEHLPLTAPPPPSPHEWQLYDALRYNVPVIDAAIRKIVRLTGGFRLTAPTASAQELLDRFSEDVPVNAAGASLRLFADQMLDSLLTYGNAVGEILLTEEEAQPVGLLTAHPSVLRIRTDNANHCTFLLQAKEEQEPIPVKHPERILFAVLDPPPGGVYGCSLLRGLPALSRILLRIYDCIGQNYERAGNVRYAVTYHPDGSSAPFAQDHAQEIARAWQKGIRAAEYGDVQGFVAVGDVDIKVIGADNALFDTNVPVRQLLEQIVSKLSIPPFLLGFSWATTERMSVQQADILTSELEAFRRILTPLLRKIGTAVLHGAGYDCMPGVEWDVINLQDERELAEARLKNAQAKEIEARLQENMPKNAETTA